MEIRVKKIEKSLNYSFLYEFLFKSEIKAGLYNRISAYDFTSILLNGITYVAYNNNNVVGFINFEILINNDQRICIHNISAVQSGPNHYYILECLYNEELKFIDKNLNRFEVNCIFLSDNFKKELSNRSYKKSHIIKRKYKSYTYRNIVFIKDDVKSKGIQLNYILNEIENSLKRTVVARLMKSLINLKKKSEIKRITRLQNLCIERIRKNRHTKVLFVVSSLSMWKYQHLYECLLLDTRFEVYIQISPFLNYSEEQKIKEMDELAFYFTEKNMSFFKFIENDKVHNVKQIVDPDVIFYTQPYDGCLHELHDFTNFKDKLLGYYPYGYTIENLSVFYSNNFKNIAWKLFYFNEFQKNNAQKYSLNKGRNVVVTGYPLSDDFKLHIPKNVWNNSSTCIKRIIWAPHFSINHHTSFTNQSNFLWMAELMLDLAKKYQGEIQIAFKPHPRLKTELYNNIKWGRLKTDNYYNQWLNLENGQLETAGFIDLFMTSDAMIHDCGSFCVDYLYTERPVMFICGDIDSYKENLDDFGKKVMDMQYIGKTYMDVETFIKDVVLGDKDIKKTERHDFVEEFLLPRNGRTVAQNTLDNLKKSLFS